MTRVVLDTNVIVSALHYPQSRLAKILALVQTRKIDLSISPFILDEVEGVLTKKWAFYSSYLHVLLSILIGRLVHASGCCSAINLSQKLRYVPCDHERLPDQGLTPYGS